MQELFDTIFSQSPFILEIAGLIKYVFAVYIGGLLIEYFFAAEPNQASEHIRFNMVYSIIFLTMNSLLYGSLIKIQQPIVEHFNGPLIHLSYDASIVDQVLHVLTFLCVFDFFYYWFHRLQHSSSLLWAQHQLHHAEKSVNITTGNRHHWLEDSLRIFLILIPMSLLFSFEAETTGVIWSVFMLWGYFIHLNIKLNFGVLTGVVSGPQLHRIHHSFQSSHIDKNYAAFFPIYDIIFGTYCRPEKGEYPATGLKDGFDMNTMASANFYPFVFWFAQFKKVIREMTRVSALDNPLYVSSNRHLGMDMVRAFAILTVLIGHSLIFLPQFFNVEGLIYLAVFGVELFFALSGFLIGNILIRMSKQTLTISHVVHFWLKRWLRTIPVYLLIAIIVMLYYQQFHASYLIFLQNNFPDQLKNFPVSWSLSIEEWFYISFPLLMLVVSKVSIRFNLNLRKFLLPISIAVFILVPIVLRYLELNAPGNWDYSIRKQIVLRLDGIAYGVLLAYLYDLYKDRFIQRRYSFLLAAALLLGFIGVGYFYNVNVNIFTAQANFFNSLIFYPMINIYSALFVAFFIRYTSYSTSRVQRVVLFVSLISYSLYLIHYPVFIWFSAFAKTASLSFLYLGISIVVMFVIGTFLYICVEKPFIKLRGKWTPAKLTVDL